MLIPINEDKTHHVYLCYGCPHKKWGACSKKGKDTAGLLSHCVSRYPKQTLSILRLEVNNLDFAGRVIISFKYCCFSTLESKEFCDVSALLPAVASADIGRSGNRMSSSSEVEINGTNLGQSGEMMCEQSSGMGIDVVFSGKAARVCSFSGVLQRDGGARVRSASKCATASSPSRFLSLWRASSNLVFQSLTSTSSSEMRSR